MGEERRGRRGGLPPVGLQNINDADMQQQTLPSAVHGGNPAHPGERGASAFSARQQRPTDCPARSPRLGTLKEPQPTCSLQVAARLGLGRSPPSWALHSKLEAAEGPSTHTPPCTRTHTHARPCTRSTRAGPPGLLGAVWGVSGFTRPQAHPCPAQHG